MGEKEADGMGCDVVTFDAMALGDGGLSTIHTIRRGAENTACVKPQNWQIRMYDIGIIISCSTIDLRASPGSACPSLSTRSEQYLRRN